MTTVAQRRRKCDWGWSFRSREDVKEKWDKLIVKPIQSPAWKDDSLAAVLSSRTKLYRRTYISNEEGVNDDFGNSYRSSNANRIGTINCADASSLTYFVSRLATTDSAVLKILETSSCDVNEKIAIEIPSHFSTTVATLIWVPVLLYKTSILKLLHEHGAILDFLGPYNILTFAQHLQQLYPGKYDETVEYLQSVAGAEDLSKYLSASSIFPTDFCIEVNGRSIPCHKSVLAKRAPGLIGGANGSFKEHSDSKLVLQDHEIEEVEWLVNSIYKYQAVGFSSENPFADDLDPVDLLKMVDMYGVDFLKLPLEAKLVEGITMHNWKVLYDRSRDFNASKLEEACLKFVDSHHDAMLSICSAFSGLCCQGEIINIVRLLGI